MKIGLKWGMRRRRVGTVWLGAEVVRYRESEGAWRWRDDRKDWKLG